MTVDLKVTKKQMSFIEAEESEVLFGGAAGGGKSYGQVVDALLFALKYPRSRQLILRRTFPELEKSLIRTSLSIFPRGIYTFNASSHVGKFKNGSTVDFGYCASEADVYQYQSAEYDVIRFDELTHFTENQYVYLISRVRGANGYPKQIKSTTNPGGIGHVWVKRRFIEPEAAGVSFVAEDGMSRIFIPSLLDDNGFLLGSDPGYKKRLLALPEREKKALLYGDWNIFEGQYFEEFDERIHVISPFEIPSHWRKYRTLDYGLDRLACLWIALSPDGGVYVYRELCMSNLPISEAASLILCHTPTGEDIYATLAPPDLWGRSQESGKSKATLFSEYGLNFTKTSNDRECGWLAVKELLKVREGDARLKIFSTCREIAKCLPALLADKLRPTDCATEPHDITHAPDALRGFAIFHTRPAEVSTPRTARWSADMWQDYLAADRAGKNYLKTKYGEPNETK
ncbi:MAG: phage terminase large subunit [Clostridia bacterium]|nr:phage terminase large subunit [Clostridia bacterium]